MTESTPLTEANIAAFVAAWYRALDFHAPVEEANRFLAESGLHIVFPEQTITDLVSFKRWYDGVTNVFFDENHYVQSIDADIDGNEATLDIIVGWQASWWIPPEAKSKRTSMTATQRWTVRRSTRNAYGLEIVTYNATVKPFDYAPGFARL